MIIFLDQPVYAKVMGRAIKVKAVIAGSDEERVILANQVTSSPNVNLGVMTDTGSVTYLAELDDMGVEINRMEGFKT